MSTSQSGSPTPSEIPEAETSQQIAEAVDQIMALVDNLTVAVGNPASLYRERLQARMQLRDALLAAVAQGREDREDEWDELGRAIAAEMEPLPDSGSAPIAESFNHGLTTALMVINDRRRAARSTPTPAGEQTDG